jgi:PAS domain S-box-containing protein
LIDEAAAKTLRPVAGFGHEVGYPSVVELDAVTMRHEHPAATAVRTGHVHIHEHRREETDSSSPETGGGVMVMALPLCGSERAFGALVVHLSRPGAFHSNETGLFAELAGDLGLAIASLRERSEHARMNEQIERMGLLKEGLLASNELTAKLKHITDGMVEIFGADFARVWMMAEGDLCDGDCVHAVATEGPQVCRDRNRCLHLEASSGRYTHIDGSHRRVPQGCYKIGTIATGETFHLLSNDVQNDPCVHNREWARSLGLMSFAGFRLQAPDGAPMGVLAMFSTRTLAVYEQRLLEDLANTTSQVMLTGMAALALQDSEEKLRTILEGCPIPQFVIDRNHRVISWNRPLEALIGVPASAVLGTTGHQAAFRKQSQSTLADLLMDGALDEILERYGPPTDPSALEKGMYNVCRFFPDVGAEGMWLKLTTAVIYDARKIAIGAVETLEDITEQKHADEELRRSRDELEKRVRQRTRELALSNCGLQSEVEQRKQVEEALRKAHHEAEMLLTSLSSFLIGTDAQWQVVRWNAAAEVTFGIPAKDALGKCIDEVGIPWEWTPIAEAFASATETSETVSLPEIACTSPEGKERFIGITIDCLRDALGELEAFILLGADVTERRTLQLQLVQAQKLESIGQLAAGIAHEINTPTQYVGDNLEFLQDAFVRLHRLLPKYAELLAASEARGIDAQLSAEIRALLKEARLDYLTSQIPRAIAQSLEGTSRVAKIVQAMKEFSHPGTPGKTAVDINRAIESTITVARNEWKYVAEVVADLDPTLPPVPCLPSEFNQVVLNLLVNAAHAVGDATRDNGEETKGSIFVSTRREGDWAVLRIRDSGKGIPEAIRHRIFDPFFTTKAVGKGTGQGLAIAHNVIVDKHGGTIAFETETGKGTTFIVQLPIQELV